MKYRVTCYFRGAVQFPVEAESADQAEEIIANKAANNELDYKVGKDIETTDFDFFEVGEINGNKYTVDCHCSGMVDIWIEANSKAEAYDLYLDNCKEYEQKLDLGDIIPFYFDPVDVTTDDEEIDYLLAGFGFFG